MSQRTVVVDMTPLGPGGQNGGAGLVATALVREFRHLASEWRFTLLTSSASDAELADLDAPNVQRMCVSTESAEPTTTPLRSAARAVLDVLPTGVRTRTKDLAWRLRHNGTNAHLMDGLSADLLFCPFTAPYFAQPDVPLVAIVHDLQHVAFPEFFSDEQRRNRDHHLREVSRQAERVVCVSEFVRQTLVAEYPTARAAVIPHALLQPFDGSAPSSEDGDYLLYPANFWPHKNHRLLFQALATYRRAHPDSHLRLMCTGAPNSAMDALREEAAELLGPGVVRFPGHVSPTEFQALLDNCVALIYPSLYEGFGMPVLEAMARGKPVICSRIPPLCEVAGDTAIYFDPEDVTDITAAIASLPADTAQLERARERASTFGDAADLARKYLVLFEEVLAGR